MRKALVSSVLAVALSLVAPPAWGATTYHVDGDLPTCSDSGPGSIVQPFCTITQGAAVAQPGDTVLVHAAVYPETVSISRSGASGSPIVIEAAPAEVPVVAGGRYGFRLTGAGWITIRGFVVTRTVDHGIYATNGSGINVSGNDVSLAGLPVAGEIASGIYMRGASASVVEDNSVHHNTNHGILIGGGTTGTTVRGNEVFRNARQYARAAAGIHVGGASSGNIVEGNVAYANEDTGFNVREGAKNNLIVRNVSRSNGDHGFDTLRATGTRYIANTAYGNRVDGISVEGNSTGTTIANCISVESGRFELYVDPGSAPGFAADYDILWDLDPSSRDVKYSGTSYTTVQTFAKATSHETHGIGANPLFVAPPVDLHLLPLSLAIDSANSGASGQPSVDLEGNQRWDDPTVANTGAGPRRYDDRGAYERQDITTGEGLPAPRVVDPRLDTLRG